MRPRTGQMLRLRDSWCSYTRKLSPQILDRVRFLGYAVTWDIAEMHGMV